MAIVLVERKCFLFMVRAVRRADSCTRAHHSKGCFKLYGLRFVVLLHYFFHSSVFVASWVGFVTVVQYRYAVPDACYEFSVKSEWNRSVSFPS